MIDDRAGFDPSLVPARFLTKGLYAVDQYRTTKIRALVLSAISQAVDVELSRASALYGLRQECAGCVLRCAPKVQSR